MGNNSKNFGQVVGMYSGTTAPDNTLLIWYDSNPSQKYHKIYDPSTSSWVALNPQVVTNITYSEIKSTATRTGLAVGKMYKLTDKSNVLAIAITSTKIQYVDTAGNYIVDDLASSKIYHISSANLTMDGLTGVFSESTGKLNFPFADKTPTFSVDYLFGKVKVGTDWVLAKFPFTKLLSTTLGNSLTWSNGLFFNFSAALTAVMDKDGGVVSKSAFEARAKTLQDNLDNISKENQQLAQNAQNRLIAATTADQIYAKQLPSAPTTGTATDIVRGDTLMTVVNKLQRYVNRFKYATGSFLTADYAAKSGFVAVNNNDTVQSAISKFHYFLFTPYEVAKRILLPTDWAPASGASATTGSPTEILNLKGGSIHDIITKLSTWVLSILHATRIPDTYTPTQIGTNRSSLAWKGKTLFEVIESIGEWLDNTGKSVKLSADYTFTSDYASSYPKAGDTLDTAIKTLSTKLDYIGEISNNYIQSKTKDSSGVARTTFSIGSGSISFRNAYGTNYSTFGSGSAYIHGSGSSYANLTSTRLYICNTSGDCVCDIDASDYAYFPKLKAGSFMISCITASTDYSITTTSGAFVCAIGSNNINIWMPGNPPNGTIVYVTKAGSGNPNVWCTADSGNGFDNQGSSSQMITIGNRGRVYFFVFIANLYYPSEGASPRMGLWQYGYMNQ